MAIADLLGFTYLDTENTTSALANSGHLSYTLAYCKVSPTKCTKEVVVFILTQFNTIPQTKG